MDNQLKELMQKLGNAINDSLSDSDRIAEVVAEIKKAGYNVFLVLEATVGFNKRPDKIPPQSDNKMNGPTHKVDFTAQDQAFLKTLRITVEE